MLLENGAPKRSNISVEFSDLGFRVLAPGDLTPTELDSTLDMLYSRVKEQENNQVNQVIVKESRFLNILNLSSFDSCFNFN